jgi:hypothetical protein
MRDVSYLAYKVNTLAQIPQPIQSGSEIYATFDSGVTSIQSFPVD